MVPVAFNYAPHTVDRNLLPSFVANVLPARNFLQHQQSKLVARIQKVPRLRIVRRSYNVAFQLVSQDLRIAPLYSSRHGLPHEWKSLMPVQSAQLDHLAIELEAVVGELRFAETNNTRDAIYLLTPAPQRHFNFVQIWMHQIPEFDGTEIRESNGMHTVFGGGTRRRNILRTFLHHPIAIAQHSFHPQRFSRSIQMLNVTIDIHTGMLAQYIFRLRKNVLDVGPWDNAQPDFAINSAKCQIINFISERRNIRTLAGIQIYRQHIVTVKIEMRRQLKRKWRISALVFSESRTVNPNSRGGHRSFKVDKHMLAARFRGQLEMTPVAGNEFVSLLVETVPGQTNVGVGNNNSFIAGFVEVFRVRPLRHCAVEKPVPVHGKNKPPGDRFFRRARQCRWHQSRSRDQRTSGLEETPPIHKSPLRVWPDSRPELSTIIEYL